MSKNYSAAMKRKWTTLVALVLVLSAFGGLLYLNAHPDGTLSLPWAFAGFAMLVGASVAGYRVLACPSCGGRLGSLRDKVCRHCGAILTDEAITLPSTDGPSPEIQAYMAGSDRILQRWAAMRVHLRHLPWVAGLVTVAGLAVWFQTAEVSHEIGESLGVAVIGGLIVAGLLWLVLRSGIDNAFGIVFSLWRGRCPACRAWFTQSTVVTPGAVAVDYSLPGICPSCGVRLR